MQEIYINHRMAAAISTTGETVHVKLLYAGSKNLLDAGTATVTSLRACLEKQIEGVQEIMLLPLEGADPDYSIELKFSGAQKSSVREDVVISLIKQAFDAELKVDKLCNLPSAKKNRRSQNGSCV